MIRTFLLMLGIPMMAAAVRADPPAPSPFAPMARTFCVDCHDAAVTRGGLDLEGALTEDPTRHPEIWERVIRQLRTRQMPPPGKARPDEDDYRSVLPALEGVLDREAALHPRPGHTETLRRMNRAEYQNAIRDLLALDIDAATMLPADESSHGFDNVTVGTLPPTLLERYVSAAQKISRLAVGGAQRIPGGETLRLRPDLTQEERVEGLPPGTRGGALIHHTFPQDGDYEVQLRLSRDRNDQVEGLGEAHELVVLLDRDQVGSFTVKPPGNEGHQHVDDHLKFRLPVTSGPHDLGVTFLKNPSSLQETKRQPYEARFNLHRHPRTAPALFQISIVGPIHGRGPGDSPSRRRVFIATPGSRADEEACAQQIVSSLLRRAYRRPVTDADLARPMAFFRDASAAFRSPDQAPPASGFDAGIEAALSAILVSPGFLFRVELEPAGLAPGTPYPVSDLDLASRLSFFLWSSIPDEELLEAAERRDLSKPGGMERQVRRMLADPRALSLVRNFAGQWLQLRNLDAITPDGRLFPDFDDNLRQAMRRETELHFEQMLRDDGSVLDLLRSDHTYLNERLAKHYGIPHIYGTRFRRVAMEPGSGRGGLMRHGSVLTVTSYATRTSPVIRGKWILENLIGTPPPPPDPDVPALDDNSVSATLPVRERLAAHRNNPTCARCHNVIDPPGFALENYDALGRWRMMEEGKPVDASGGLPDGSRFTGVDGLEQGLLDRPEIFVSTVTEKLITFALGRGVEDYDGPAVREVVRRARQDEFRFSAIVLGIVDSTPFRMRESR